MFNYNIFDFIKPYEVDEKVLDKLKGMLLKINNEVNMREIELSSTNRNLMMVIEDAEFKRMKYSITESEKYKSDVVPNIEEVLLFLKTQVKEIDRLREELSATQGKEWYLSKRLEEYKIAVKENEIINRNQRDRDLQMYKEAEDKNRFNILSLRSNIVEVERDFKHLRELVGRIQYFEVENLKKLEENQKRNEFEIKQKYESLLNSKKMELENKNRKVDTSSLVELVGYLFQIKNELAEKVNLLEENFKILLKKNEKQEILIEKYKKIKQEFVKLKSKTVNNSDQIDNTQAANEINNPTIDTIASEFNTNQPTNSNPVTDIKQNVDFNTVNTHECTVTEEKHSANTQQLEVPELDVISNNDSNEIKE